MEGKHGEHRLIPIVDSLVFIRSIRSRLRGIGFGLPCFRCVVSVHGKRGVVIPSSRVERFVTITKACSRRLVFFDPSRIGLQHNAGIHVANNSFRNCRKMFMGMGNTESHHIIVDLRKIVTVTVTALSPSLVRIVRRPGGGWLRLLHWALLFPSWQRDRQSSGVGLVCGYMRPRPYHRTSNSDD